MLLAWPAAAQEKQEEQSFWSRPDLLDDPGGGIPNPHNPSRRIGNGAVFGLRSLITF